mgnify:CR=1 FL=1|jgi:hypothetical protein
MIFEKYNIGVESCQYRIGYFCLGPEIVQNYEKRRKKQEKFGIYFSKKTCIESQGVV